MATVIPVGRRMDINNMTVKVTGVRPTADGMTLDFDIEEIRVTQDQLDEMAKDAREKYGHLIRVVEDV